MDKDIFVQVSDAKVIFLKLLLTLPMSRPTILKPRHHQPDPPQTTTNPKSSRFLFQSGSFLLFSCIRILRPNPLSPATNHSNLQPFPQPHKIRLRHRAQILSTPLRKISAPPLGMFWYLQSHPRQLPQWRSPPSFSPRPPHRDQPQGTGSSLAGLRYSMSGTRKSCRGRP